MWKECRMTCEEGKEEESRVRGEGGEECGVE